MDAVVRDNPASPTVGNRTRGPCRLFVDAGVRHLRLRACGDGGSVLYDDVIPGNRDLRDVFAEYQIGKRFGADEDTPVFITGKLAATVRDTLGYGKVVLPAALFWLAARDLLARPENGAVASLALLDLSASGYLLVGIDRRGELKDDLLLLNPRCGAGSGINLDRVLQKLALTREEVDPLLADYLGEAGREQRGAVSVRADRCGVFASSATISDKNQGIPVAVALATTLKSEVLKACRKLPKGFDKVYLTGRIFRWQYARACAEDHLRANGVREIACDTENTQILESLRTLVGRIGADRLAQPDTRLIRPTQPEEYPAFAELKTRYEASGRYLRLADDPLPPFTAERLRDHPVILGLDVGSTMAKAVLADARSGEHLFQAAYSNAGDTIETVKQVFRDLRNSSMRELAIRNIGITGSARYQVQQALTRIYPVLEERIAVLVENYAHARGSIEHARQHIRRLKAQGHTDVNEQLCILIDIGGEDTKISTIALEQAELFDNAMNLKCSAGTGSLMDTLSAMFGIGSIAEACAEAYAAPRSFAINATCAVFLMENASKLQAQGVAREQILASANWAIVENMARSLWTQLELPGNAVVLLHGQTMLSEPLPLAVTHRLHSYLGRPVYALVPPSPGHRACIGLIHTLQQASAPGFAWIQLDDFIDTRFEKRVISCKGTACGDPDARCNRCALRCRGTDGSKISFTLGGCTAINELLGRLSKHQERIELPRDAYQEIWDFIDSRHPRSEDPRRLVIPRSFVVSEWAYFLTRLFEPLGIPVHVDTVRETDLTDAQPDFTVDTCAPQIGAVGQYRRLASEPHGMILAPQIETLPTGGMSRGLACTTNQGGVAVASNLAGMACPAARFHLFHLDLDRLDAAYLCDQLHGRLQALFTFYGIAPSAEALQEIIGQALEDHRQLRQETADLAADLAEEALAAKRQVALVVGREYVLNPGIYDSHIRRLLRDKQLTVIPSYVLDVELDEAFSHIYWRNPHFIVSLLNAVSHRSLHRRLKHPRLREIFRTIESDPEGTLLPVVQISTFSCGPDSVTAHYIAEIMKQRPFLLIQSDAVIKELAHLENRVNTYVKQLEQGLHGKLHIAGGDGPFEIHRLDSLSSQAPPNRETDVIYFPTLSDNRSLCAVLRGAGYTCIDNYDDETHDLQALVKAGRKAAGDAVCTPLASMYADLLRSMDDFVRRKQAGDPRLAGKKRLLYFDSQGSGPCRQGQYPHVHKLLFYQRAAGREDPAADTLACNALPGGGIFQLMVGKESEGYGTAFGEWALLRAYQGVILQGVLHGLLFKGAAACRDYEEYLRFIDDYRTLKREIYRLLESYHGPGPIGRRLLESIGKHDLAGIPLKFLLYRLRGQEFSRPLRRFADTWITSRPPPDQPLKIGISGEGYMRVSQAEDIFRTLLATLGFRRFTLQLTPLMSFLEYLLDEAELNSRSSIEVATAGSRRKGAAESQHDKVSILQQEQHTLRKIRLLRFILRNILAHPLYKAARLEMPMCSAEMMNAAKELLPTLRPRGELAPYIGEALSELRHGVDVLLNVGPSGCLVSSMSEMLTPRITQAAGTVSGRIQTLFSTDGDVNEELLTLAVLKAMGPERYYDTQHAVKTG
jgi:activator of 2-hydroxyglutaryl-CoA dehydratase/predicted nucleotide-binding protein (sugar kinase/HSP70/actin superfamily)